MAFVPMKIHLLLLERADQLEELKLAETLFTSFVPVTIIPKIEQRRKSSKILG
jgi:hypothetical protein